MVAEYFYRVEHDKKFWDRGVRDNKSYSDTTTHFGKLGINYIF
ncbi:putative exported domain protein [Yersinia pestis PY-66]|nr:putative exported domain protein [Yersinia pestis PY-53]EIS73018.1 putative exported domain protein [Yersinia pestis PY-66]